MFVYSVQGLQSSFALMENAALEAQKGIDGDLVKAQIDMIDAKYSTGANLAVLKTADSMYKSLIDILA